MTQVDEKEVNAMMRYIVALLVLMVVVQVNISAALAEGNPFSTGGGNDPFRVCSQAPSQYECWQQWNNRSFGGHGG